MKRPVFAVVLALFVLAAVANVGFKLVGALRQIDALAGTSVRNATSAAVLVLPRITVPVEVVPVVAPARGVPESEPAPRFDAEAAVREAGDRDANVAELLNDPDQTVGGAVRGFLTSLAAPGGN